MVTMWCERCQKETLHKEIGFGEYDGAMRQWYSCEENECYNEKVLAPNVQIRKGVYLQPAQHQNWSTIKKGGR